MLRIAGESKSYLSQKVKLFTPGEDADDDDYGENSCRDQVALHIHVVKHGVEFFHNLNFSFQKWFRSGFQRGGNCMIPRRVQFKRSTEIKNRAFNFYHF